jgi:hypothetical protein
MGKRGKAARKRRRENEVVNTTAALASKIATSAGDSDNHPKSDDSTNDRGSAMMAETGHHGIPDAALDVTVATLHRLCGLVDPTTQKPALRDKRYRGLRRVLYELQSGVVAGGVHASISGLRRSGSDASGAASSLAGAERGAEHGDPPPPVSSSKITREISAQIESGAWALAANTLRNLRRRQEEHATMRGNETAKSSANYLRPKLGAVQRWVRQLDAAGTDDSLALGVLDAILRVVSPETILPVHEVDIENATWARLGVNSSSSDGDGKHEGCGRVRLFLQLDLRQRGHGSKPTEDSRVERDFVDSLVSCMQVGEDGIRRISSPEANARLNVLFRRCG